MLDDIIPENQSPYTESSEINKLQDIDLHTLARTTCSVCVVYVLRGAAVECSQKASRRSDYIASERGQMQV